MNDRQHVDPLLTVDVVLVDQLAEAMQLRQDLDPDPERDEAIRQLRAIRNHLVHNAKLAVTSDEAQAALTLVLRHLVHTQAGSLGDAQSRRVRRQTSPAAVSEILTRVRSAEQSRSPQTQPVGRGRTLSKTDEPVAHATTTGAENAVAQVHRLDQRTMTTTTRRDLISTATRGEFRSLMTDSTVGQITTVFQDEGFAPNPDCTYGSRDSSVRRITTQEYLDSVDWSDSGHIARVLHVFERLLDGFVDTERFRRLLRRDGYAFSDTGEIVTVGARLPTGSLTDLRDPTAILEQLTRIQRAMIDDPALAVGSAKGTHREHRQGRPHHPRPTRRRQGRPARAGPRRPASPRPAPLRSYPRPRRQRRRPPHPRRRHQHRSRPGRAPQPRVRHRPRRRRNPCRAPTPTRPPRSQRRHHLVPTHARHARRPRCTLAAGAVDQVNRRLLEARSTTPYRSETGGPIELLPSCPQRCFYPRRSV